MMILVDPVFNPNGEDNVSSATKLGHRQQLLSFLVHMEIELHLIMLVATMKENKLQDNCIYKQK